VTSGNTIHSTKVHNHMSDPGSVFAQTVQNSIPQKAFDNPLLKTSTLEFVTKTEDPSFRTRAVALKTLQKKIQRRKAKAKAQMKPAAPKTFDDLALIPDEFTVHR
jgi:hypothetical protein